MKAEIEGIELKCTNKFDPVTYVCPWDKKKKDMSQTGVLISWDDFSAKVLFCKSRTVQSVEFKDLVWG